MSVIIVERRDNGLDQWDVESLKDQASSFYIVNRRAGVFFCNCMDCVQRNHECKHIDEVKIDEGKDRSLQLSENSDAIEKLNLKHNELLRERDLLIKLPIYSRIAERFMR